VAQSRRRAKNPVVVDLRGNVAPAANPAVNTLGDAFYYTVVPLSTVGVGDILAVTAPTRHTAKPVGTSSIGSTMRTTKSGGMRGTVGYQ